MASRTFQDYIAAAMTICDCFDNTQTRENLLHDLLIDFMADLNRTEVSA